VKFLKSAAFHEAAHAVARAHVGAKITGAEIRRDGTGFSEGTGKLWRSGSGGQYAAWDSLIVTLSGAYAEARICKRSRAIVCMTSGREDFEEARQAVDWLTARGYANSREGAWDRAERETLEFMRARWPDIERVAAGLLQRGKLTAREVRRCLKGSA
jgi:hypothetical protein